MKHPSIIEALNALNPYPRDSGVCVTCGSTKMKPEDFASDLERREFEISQMCHDCQVSAFAPMPEDAP